MMRRIFGIILTIFTLQCGLAAASAFGPSLGRRSSHHIPKSFPLRYVLFGGAIITAPLTYPAVAWALRQSTYGIREQFGMLGQADLEDDIWQKNLAPSRALPYASIYWHGVTAAGEQVDAQLFYINGQLRGLEYSDIFWELRSVHRPGAEFVAYPTRGDFSHEKILLRVKKAWSGYYVEELVLMRGEEEILCAKKL